MEFGWWVIWCSPPWGDVSWLHQRFSETDIILTDQNTNQQDNYEIISINEESAFMNGTVNISQDIMGFEIDFEIDVQMQLVKQNN